MEKFYLRLHYLSWQACLYAFLIGSCAQSPSLEEGRRSRLVLCAYGSSEVDSIRTYLRVKGFECRVGDQDLGYSWLHIDGSLGDKFRTRALLRQFSLDTKRKLHWPADILRREKLAEDEKDGILNQQPEPWIQVALNSDLEYSTEAICRKLSSQLIDVEVMFGETIDWILVHPRQHAEAAAILQEAKNSSYKFVPF